LIRLWKAQIGKEVTYVATVLVVAEDEEQALKLAKALDAEDYNDPDEDSWANVPVVVETEDDIPEEYIYEGSNEVDAVPEGFRGDKLVSFYLKDPEQIAIDLHNAEMMKRQGVLL